MGHITIVGSSLNTVKARLDLLLQRESVGGRSSGCCFTFTVCTYVILPFFSFKECQFCHLTCVSYWTPSILLSISLDYMIYSLFYVPSEEPTDIMGKENIWDSFMSSSLL